MIKIGLCSKFWVAMRRKLTYPNNFYSIETLRQHFYYVGAPNVALSIVPGGILTWLCNFWDISKRLKTLHSEKIQFLKNYGTKKEEKKTSFGTYLIFSPV